MRIIRYKREIQITNGSFGGEKGPKADPYKRRLAARVSHREGLEQAAKEESAQ